MSKKKIYSKHLQKGRFYVHGDKHGGHPALLYKKRDNKNMYYIIIFTSSPGRKRTKLRHNLDSTRVKKSFVHNYPSVAKRRDLGGKVLTILKLNKEDKPLVKSIQKKKWFTETNKGFQCANHLHLLKQIL